MANSKIVVYGAIAGNVGIAITKFIVAGLSGSSAMLSEGIHSAVDTGNGLLLLVGMNRSNRRADSGHPFGYGKEIYFWSLIVAVLIFGVGGGISALQGILHILHPAPIEDAKWNYIVLGIAALFEGSSFLIAVRAINKDKGDLSFVQALRKSKDPSTFTVIAEDGAALTGLAIAGLGIYLAQRLEMPMLDGVASLLIGILLAGVSLLLIFKSRTLLVGSGVDSDTRASIREMVGQDRLIASVSAPLTMYFGPDSVLLALDVSFVAGVSGEQIASTVDALEQRIRERFPEIRRIYIEAV